MSLQGKYPDVVIGTVFVTDADDHDVDDKTFEVDPATSGAVERWFTVDKSSGNITMAAGTPPGDYTLIAKVSNAVIRKFHPRKFHPAKIPPSENSTHENSTQRKFHPVKIPPSENSTQRKLG